MTMTAALTLHDMAVNMTIPLDALADLAAAIGYEARRDRAAAELYLGFALSKLGSTPVTPASVADLLRLITAIAQGNALTMDRM